MIPSYANNSRLFICYLDLSTDSRHTNNDPSRSSSRCHPWVAEDPPDSGCIPPANISASDKLTASTLRPHSRHQTILIRWRRTIKTWSDSIVVSVLL